MNRQELFQKFLKENSYYIDYNGVAYTLVNQQNKAVTQTQTPEEMMTFILGWNKASENFLVILEESKKANAILKEQNEANILNYESMIQNMGGETMDLPTHPDLTETSEKDKD